MQAKETAPPWRLVIPALVATCGKQRNSLLPPEHRMLLCFLWSFEAVRSKIELRRATKLSAILQAYSVIWLITLAYFFA